MCVSLVWPRSNSIQFNLIQFLQFRFLQQRSPLRAYSHLHLYTTSAPLAWIGGLVLSQSQSQNIIDSVGKKMQRPTSNLHIVSRLSSDNKTRRGATFLLVYQPNCCLSKSAREPTAALVSDSVSISICVVRKIWPRCFSLGWPSSHPSEDSPLTSDRMSFGSTDPSGFLFSPLIRFIDVCMVRVPLGVILLLLDRNENTSKIRELKPSNSRGRTGRQLMTIPMAISINFQQPIMTTL